MNMSNNYIGKICPYCKTPLVEGDTVVFCRSCDMPHHLSCWQDNQGCTTFGCAGFIREIIGIEIEAPAAPAAPQPIPAPKAAPKPVQTTPAKPAPAPAQMKQPDTPIETLHESNEMVFMSEVPIVLENTAIKLDRTKDKLSASCTFRSITDKAIKAVLIEVVCQDVWNNALGEPIAFQYLDLKTKRESKFGQADPIDLPDKMTRKIQVAVKKVLFADDSVISCSGTTFTMPAPVLLSKHLGSDALAAEYARETTPKAQFVLETSQDRWRCACGALNTDAEEKCHHCGCTREQLTAALDPEVLNANMVSFAEAQRAAQEQAQAEQAERIRLAEEQVRLEQAHKKQEIKTAQNLARKKKRRKKTVTAIIVSLVVVALLGCGTIFFGIPYYHYRAACDALDNGQYDTAYQAFTALGNFMDSEDMANKSLYEKAEAALENKQYDSAIQIFQSLGDYMDSEEMANSALYQKATAELKNKEYDSAIQIFTDLGDYEDSANQVLEAKYLKAQQYREHKTFGVAYNLFIELGDYKDSRNQVLSTILLWEAEALGSSYTSLATTLADTVKLDPSYYDAFYSAIILFLNAHEDADYWYVWGGTSASKNVQTMLKMLPASYEDTNTLLKLFNLLAKDWGDCEELFRDNETLMRQCWSLAFIQNLAAEDSAICYFLEGNWTTYSGDYYLDFYENDEGGTNSSHDLPWVSKPSGTKYYDIEDMIYYWDDDYNHLAKVYRFEIIDYDTIKVFCYKNNRTYTLYR